MLTHPAKHLWQLFKGDHTFLEKITWIVNNTAGVIDLLFTSYNIFSSTNYSVVWSGFFLFTEITKETDLLVNYDYASSLALQLVVSNQLFWSSSNKRGAVGYSATQYLGGSLKTKMFALLTGNLLKQSPCPDRVTAVHLYVRSHFYARGNSFESPITWTIPQLYHMMQITYVWYLLYTTINLLNSPMLS